MQRVQLTCLLLLFLYSCANVVNPTGGEKDNQAPLVLSSDPPNYSTNFSERTITLYLNEYVKLNSPERNVLISPPLKNPPDYKIRKKTVVINLDDSLLPNTTYIFNLDEVISDVNEGNKLKEFKYVFSTGNELDSLRISGITRILPEVKGEEGIYVLLFKGSNDSAVYNQLPDYFTKTDKQGKFTINYIKEGEYQLFAVKEINNNYNYDLSDELIAFLDTNIIINDTTGIYDLFLFNEDERPLKLNSVSVPSYGKLILAFSKPFNSLEFEIAQDIDFQRVIREESTNKDSLIYWFKEFDQGFLNAKITTLDTLFLESKSGMTIEDEFYEKLKNSQPQWLDTCHYDLIKDTSKTDGWFFIKTCIDDFEIENPPFSDSSTLGKGQRLKIGSNIPKKGFLNFNEGFILNFSKPVAKSLYDAIYLFEDTLKTRVNAKFSFEDSSKRKLKVLFPWKDNLLYVLHIPDSAFIDFQDNPNDSISFNFQTTAKSNFGSIKLLLDMNNSNSSYVLVLANKNEEMSHYVITSDTTLDINYIPATKYKLSIINDVNGNGKWDPGNYQRTKQAEQIFIYPDAIILRANWNMEIELDLS
ncbi:MAG: Ig-like domain-containing protein [Bacteroidetes bacterium]|nr:Ig-like domain-containing protein [Bacteroidota bacterium]